MHVRDVSEGVLADCRLATADIGTTLADISDEVAVDRLFHEVRSGLGGLDVLVNNASIAGPTDAVEDGPARPSGSATETSDIEELRPWLNPRRSSSPAP